MKMTHSFRVGSWRKINQTAKDHANFLMNSTNAQRSVIHEACSQMLGHEPSSFWGHPVPGELLPHAEQSTLHFVRQASKHSAHEFGRLISSHKKGSGWISEFGSLIGGAAKTAGKYAKIGGKYLIAHGDEIKTGVGVIKNIVGTTSGIAHLAGYLSKENKDTLDEIASLVNAHAQSDVYKPSKKGGRIRV